MSRKPLTGEARRKKLEELKKEFPDSAENLDEWEGTEPVQPPVTHQDWQEFQKGLAIEEEPVKYSINPICQDMLRSDVLASEKVTEMVKIYLEDHPEFVPPDDEEFMQHPSYLALYRPIKHWFFTQCGSKLELWTLMLAAAKEWFPDKNNTKLGHTFCVRFEIEDCTWWNGRTEFQPVLRDYIKWHYDREM